MSIPELATKRVVTTSMIIITMILSGFYSLTKLNQELLPNFAFPIVVVNTTWPGASPEDVNDQITTRIEDVMSNVEGVTDMNSTSSLGVSTIVLEFDYGVDEDIKKNQVQSEIDKISNDLPLSAGQRVNPIVDTADTGGNAVTISLSGASQDELVAFAEDFLKDNFKMIEGVAGVTIYGGLTREIKVEMDPNKLEAHNLSPQEVYNIISSSSTTIPSGYIKEGEKEYLLRVIGDIKTTDQVKDIVIINQNGNLIKLKDIAKVSFSTKDRENYSNVQGKQSISIGIQKSNSGNTVAIVKKVNDRLKAVKPFFPQGSSYEFVYDGSQEISDSINNLAGTGVMALILASIVLFVFLKDWRSTLVVAMSIPISIIFTFFLLYASGASLNVISLMGLSLGIGMLVDNSVVVLDNVFRHMKEYKRAPMEAAVTGTNEVIVSLVASTATSVCVFFPVLLQNNFTKQIFWQMCSAIIFSLITSIVVAMLFVPMAASRFLNEDSANKEDPKFMIKLRDSYEKLIKKCLEHRAITVITVLLSFFIIVFGLGGFIKTEFFPNNDTGKLSIAASLAEGLDIDKAYEVTKRIEAIVSADEDVDQYSSITEKDFTSVNIVLKGEKGTYKKIDEFREQVKNIPDAVISITDDFSYSEPSRDLEVKIEGPDTGELSRMADEITRKMKTEKFLEVDTSLEGGAPQSQLIIDRDKAETYGLSVSDIASYLNYAVLGIDPIEIISNGNTYDVTIQFEEKFRDTTQKILDTYIKTSNGAYIRLGQIAKSKIVEGPAAITKHNSIQSVTIKANVGSMGLNVALEKFKKYFDESNPLDGYGWSLAGDSRFQSDMSSQIGTALLISIVLMYAILASQLESFIMPLVILSSFPLSMIGVFIGLITTGTALGLFVMIGILVLAGTVVNNAIVLIDYVNILRTKGVELFEAIAESGKTRLRPILMTTLTTVLSWIPMALGIGKGSGYYQGMAIAVMFGLSISTLLTLVFIPVVYGIIENRKEKRLEKKKRKLASKGV